MISNEVLIIERLKRALCVLLAFAVVFPLFLLWGCVKFTVTFVTNGGEVIEKMTGAINEMPIPVREGFKFTGWYENPNFLGGGQLAFLSRR